MRKLCDSLAPSVLLFLVCVGFYWKLLLVDQYTWLAGGDTVYQVLPWFQMQAAEWHAGRVPLWDPYTWGGQPLIGQAQPGAAYPLNWLLFNLPLRNGWIRQDFLHWYFVLIHYMAILFAYWMCRDLGRTALASALAALVFGLGGFMGTTDWPQMLNGAVWAPLVLLFLFRAFRGDRPMSSSALGGMFLGISWLSGHHQIPIYVTVASAALWLFNTWHSGLNKRSLAPPVIFFVITALGGALQTLPAYEYGQLARRWVGSSNAVGWHDVVPYSVHTTLSFNPMAIVGIVIPGLNDNADGYLGITAVSLAALGLLAGRREKVVWLSVAVSIFGLFFAVGNATFIHGLLYSLLPLVEKARSPSMAIFLFQLGLTPLIAWGADSLRQSNPHSRKIAASVFVFAALYLSFVLASTLAERNRMEDRVNLVGFLALACCAILYGVERKTISPRTGIVALAALAATEVANIATYYLPNTYDKEHRVDFNKLSYYTDIIEFISTLPRPVRVDISRELIPFNFGDWHGISLTGGYMASLTENSLNGDHSQKGLNLQGAAYAVALQPPAPAYQQVFEARDGLKVFHNRDAYPRAWVESSETCAQPGHADILAHNPGRVLIHARLPCPGAVILSDTYYPGWRATVDGHAAEITQVHSWFRRVDVPSGYHLIEYRYRPLSVYLGAALSALGLASALLLRWRDFHSLDRSPA